MEVLKNDVATSDFSKFHENLGTFGENPKSASQWNNYKLPQSKVEEFMKNGFISGVPMLTSEECDLLLEDYSIFTSSADVAHPGIQYMYEFHANQTQDPDNVLLHALGQWRVTRAFHDLIFLPQVLMPVSQLLAAITPEIASDGPLTRVRFWHDQLFAKPPHHGGCVAWHQDYSYWTRTRPMNHITVHIALDAQTEENGALQYVPGSHSWTRDGAPLPVTDFNFKDMESIKTILSPAELAEFRPVSSSLARGHASFHHALAVHGSYGNRSSVPRRATVLNYFGDGVRSAADEELLKDIKIPKGDLMSGQFFPLVFDPVVTQEP